MSVFHSKISLMGSAAAVGFHMLMEKTFQAGSQRESSIPAGFSEMTTQWLSTVLCKNVEGAEVLSFRLDKPSNGTTSRALVHLTYNEEGTSAGSPTRVFAKSTVRFTERLTARFTLAPVMESIFFNHIQSELADIETTEAYFSGYELPSCRSMILMKYLEHCSYTNPTSYISLENARDMMSLLARVHARFWNSPRFESDLAMIKSSCEYQNVLNGLSFEERHDVGIDRAAKVIHPEILKRRSELFSACMTSLRLQDQFSQTLLHNDVHIGNWYRTAENRMGLCDWQGLVKGNFACDIAYALGSALTIEDRRAWERALIMHYLDVLREEGVTEAIDLEKAWLHYRQQYFHALVFWTFTIGAGKLQSDMQPDEYSLINLERITTAMADIDSLGSLGKRQ